MGELVDSVTRNLWKGDSALLSEEESNSESFQLYFLFEKAICIICYSLVQNSQPTTIPTQRKKLEILFHHVTLPWKMA